MTQTRSGLQAPAAVVLVLLLGLACSPARIADARANGGSQTATVVVTPEAATVAPYGELPLAATVTGLADPTVVWSVEEGTVGGAVTESGVYRAPATTGTFHVRVESAIDSDVRDIATIRVSAAPPPPPPPPGTDQAMTTAHRTSGVAPLAVFFDAVDDVARTSPNRSWAWNSGVYQPADKEGSLYAWDFGDPTSGTWSTTGRLKNNATGYTAAHVFETPGTYTVTLTITDPAGNVRSYAQQITVTAFSGTTFYVAANGNDSNNGLSQTAPLRTLANAMTRALATSGPVQVLLRRGDTFSVVEEYAIVKPGPGLVGAYGTGTRPVVNVQDVAGWGALSPRAAGEDWRFVDLDFRHSSSDSAVSAVGPPPHIQARNLLVLRCRGQNFRNGAFSWADHTPIHATPHDGMFIVDSESTSPNHDYGAFIGGRRLAVLGSNIHDIGTSHALRVWQAHKAVISNNRLWNPGPTRHALKLHSATVGDGRADTRWVSVSDNLLRGKTWSVIIGATDMSSGNEQPAHVVFERNRFWGEASVQMDVRVRNSFDVMVRNNIFDARGASNNYTAIGVVNEGGVLLPGDRVRVYNNTVSRIGEASRGFAAVEISGGMTNVTVLNNLAAPGDATDAQSPDGVNVVGTAPGLIRSSNLQTNSPGFTNPAAGDFTLGSGSPAADAGTTLSEVRDDYAGTDRPHGSGEDLGAYESR